MHDLDGYLTALAVFWALVPAYFAVAFLLDEHELPHRSRGGKSIA